MKCYINTVVKFEPVYVFIVYLFIILISSPPSLHSSAPGRLLLYDKTIQYGN